MEQETARYNEYRECPKCGNTWITTAFKRILGRERNRTVVHPLRLCMERTAA